VKRLLTIDDEREFTSFIKSYFEVRGFHVYEAQTGDKGLEIANAEKPDIVLCDLKMPGKHGDEILIELLSILPTTKVIMITASEGYGKTRERLIELGAFACFDKPLSSVKVLEDKIKEALG